MSEDSDLQVMTDRGCFVCGTDNPAGLQAKLVVDRENGAAASRLTLDQRFQGWQDVIHGGILATLLDEVAIYACRSQGEQFVTAEINVRYRKPVPVNSRIELKGRIVEKRRKLYRVESQIEIGGMIYADAEVKILCLDQ